MQTLSNHTQAPSVAENDAIPLIEDLRVSSAPWTPDIAAETAAALLEEERVAARERPDFDAVFAFKCKKSMLHTDTLTLMRYVAAATHGPIVELGAYIGGATTMFAKGVSTSRKLITLEPGGSFPDHPDLPSNDFIADLEQTLSQQQIRDRVTLLKMASWEAHAKPALMDALQGEQISVLCIDSDGYVGRDIDLYKPLCAPGCILIVDDFLDTGDDLCHKSDRVKPYITQCVDEGKLLQFGVYQWSTWFGRFA
jgi:predicted O-methyltransferase YrrM